MNCSYLRSLGLLLLVFASTPVFSTEPWTPAAGTVERKAIADALRTPVKTELKRDVIFKIDRLKVLDGWAFLAGVPLKPDGSEMSYQGTVHEEAIREGAFDGGIFALLQKRGGEWTVVRFIIGATDVPYVDWPKELGAPKSLFD